MTQPYAHPRAERIRVPHRIEERSDPQLTADIDRRPTRRTSDDEPAQRREDCDTMPLDVAIREMFR